MGRRMGGSAQYSRLDILYTAHIRTDTCILHTYTDGIKNDISTLEY
jgi:hypothetical protein